MRFYEDAGPRGVRWIFRRLSSLANQKPGARSTGRADFTPWRRPDRPPISPAWPGRASHRAAQRLIGGADPGSDLVLLEADTGSGKTEAALWRYATAQAPWEYRANRWQRAVAGAPDGCTLKGHISTKGERIYHAPWSSACGGTQIDEQGRGLVL